MPPSTSEFFAAVANGEHPSLNGDVFAPHSTPTALGVGTPKLDIILPHADRLDPMLQHRTPSGKVTVGPNHPAFEALDHVVDTLDSQDDVGVSAGGNMPNIVAYLASKRSVDARGAAFYDPAHPQSRRYTHLAGQFRVPLHPIVVPGMPISTNVIVRHLGGERQIFRYVPDGVRAAPNPEYLDELIDHIHTEEWLVVATSAGFLATGAAIAETPLDTLLAYSPGNELDDPANMRHIMGALQRRYEHRGRTLVMANREEAEAITGEHGGVVELMHRIHRQRFASEVYITDGPYASVLSNSVSYATFVPPKTEVKGTTTGAGDRGAAVISNQLASLEAITWGSEELMEAQYLAYREVLPVLQVPGAMDDLPRYPLEDMYSGAGVR